MRILLALTLILGSATAASAQRGMVSAQPAARLVVSDGVFRGEMPTARVPYYADWPQVTVPARALKRGVEPTVPEFRVRGWREGDGVRVWVFSVTVSGSRLVREQQIASVFVPIDQYVEITATEKYRARRLTLTAYQDRPTQPPYMVKTPHIDIPVRPWTPPQR